MLVRNANLALESYSSFQRSQQNVQVTLENGRLIDDGSRQTRLQASMESIQQSAEVRISDYARNLLNGEKKSPVPSSNLPSTPYSPDDTESLPSDGRLLLLKRLLEALTGKSFNTPEFNTAENVGSPLSSSSQVPGNTISNTQRTQIGLSLIQEYEYTEVSMSGSINLADGRSISLSMSISMERSYQQTAFSVLQEQGVLKDPLAISLNGQAISLSSSMTFEFDMNSDGEAELFASLSTNAAFISLDLNADGIVNNGKELFGANSGNGFADLRAYDEDKNGFIDEGDSVFAQLFAWNPATGILGSLKDLGVGALYTQSIDSPFKLNDTNNRNLGIIRSSGLYLNEDGSSGLLQQVDLRS